MFIYIVALAALFIAACAAFFSIKGLMILFAGSAISVGIMASSLELGKLVTASFLHREWKRISLALKIYLSIAVGVLMLITSLGIFGFLTKAYQEHHGKVVVYQTELQGTEAQIGNLKEELKINQERIDTLGALRKDQEARVTAAGNLRSPREQAYRAIAEANKEIQEKGTRQTELRKKILDLEGAKTNLTTEMNTKTDIGSFQFVAGALGVDVDTAVRIFILSLVFVFDPLAVSLVLALNILVERREEEKEKTETVSRKSAASPAFPKPTPLPVTPTEEAVEEKSTESPITLEVREDSGSPEQKAASVGAVLKKRELDPSNDSILTRGK